MQWTDSKVALVEFIYALYASRCFNNGNTSLKDIAFCCETLFHIEIGDFYRIFLEIRNRKKSRTQFPDKLKEQIIRNNTCNLTLLSRSKPDEVINIEIKCNLEFNLKLSSFIRRCFALSGNQVKRLFEQKAIVAAADKLP